MDSETDLPSSLFSLESLLGNIAVVFTLMLSGLMLYFNQKPEILSNNIRTLISNEQYNSTFSPFGFVEEELDQVKIKAIRIARTLNNASDYERMIRAKCAYFGCNSAQVIRIMYCESTANRYAANGVYKGLFQHHQTYWISRAARAGLPGASIYDPYAQIHVTTEMFSRGLGYHWECK